MADTNNDLTGLKKDFFITLPIFLLLGVLASVAGAASKLDLKIEPSVEDLRPNRDEARLTLRPGGEETAGKMIHWNLSVDLPRRGSFFSTDFPWIEGKRLLKIDFLTSEKEVSWSMLFPIRGSYEFHVRTGVEGKSLSESRFLLDIREDPGRLFYLGLSVAGLFGLGALIGWTFSTKGAAAGIALLFLAGVGAEAALEAGPARVGELTPIRLAPPDAGESRVELSIVRAEDGKRLFHIEDVMVRGGAAWGYHFFDGSPHRLTASVRPRSAVSPSIVEKEIHVEAREPPRRVVLTTFAFFLAPLAAGWPAGRWIRRIQKKL